jgi:hypothetical protein
MLVMSTDAQPDRLLKIVALSLALGRRHLADYGSYKSRKDFTQHQLMACLILRTYLKTTYRGVIELLAVSGELREAIGGWPWHGGAIPRNELGFT